jgi:hypothetical protein
MSIYVCVSYEYVCMCVMAVGIGGGQVADGRQQHRQGCYRAPTSPPTPSHLY